jgi:hypothetical protein
MFEQTCTYQNIPDGCVFLPEDAESASCALRVTFEPLAWYPAEPSVGAGADFDAAIILIEMSVDADGEDWRCLSGRDYQAAEAFLETHHHDALWAQAEHETAEAFDAVSYRRAA